MTAFAASRRQRSVQAQADISASAYLPPFAIPGFWLKLACVVITFSVLWPRYAYLALPGLPSMTLSFLITAAACGLIIGKALTYPPFAQKIAVLYARLPSLTWMLGLWFAVQIVANILGEASGTSFWYFLVDCQNLTNMLAIGAIVAFDARERHTIFRLLVALAIAACLIGVFERIVKQPVILYFPSSLISGIGQSRLGYLFYPLVRDNVFRVRSVFSHPIVFGQFCAMMMPIAWYVFKRDASKIWRLLALGTMVIIPSIVATTGARSGLLSVGAAGVCVLLTTTISSLRRGGKNAVWGLVSLGVLIVAGVFVATFAQDLTAGRTQTEAESGYWRLVQLERAQLSLESSPIIGFGEGRSGERAGVMSSNGNLSIDCYFLSLAVDFGYLGLLIYCAMMVVILMISFKIATDPTSPRDNAGQAEAIFAMHVAMITTFVILSITDMMSVCYLTLPLLMGAAPPRMLNRMTLTPSKPSRHPAAAAGE